MGNTNSENCPMLTLLEHIQIRPTNMAQGRVSDICLKTATLRWWAEIAF